MRLVHIRCGWLSLDVTRALWMSLVLLGCDCCFVYAPGCPKVSLVLTCFALLDLAGTPVSFQVLLEFGGSDYDEANFRRDATGDSWMTLVLLGCGW